MKKCLLLILLIILSACSNKSTDPENDQDKIMPLAVGNSWSFTDMPTPGYIGDTTNYTLTILKDTVMTISIDSALEIGRWYKLSGFPLPTPQYLANRPNGLWQVIFYNDATMGKITIVNRLAKFPAKVGDIFLHPYPPPLQSGTMISEVIAIDSLVTVPAGSFRCVVYQFRLQSTLRLVFDAFYAPGVGRIKTNYHELAPGDNAVTRESRLTGTNVNK